MSNKAIVKTVADFIEKNGLLDKDGRYLVGLSGGADSVALLLILKELDYHVEAVHCHFHLRGAESDRDEAFCVSLCRKNKVELHRVHFDTMEYASLHKVSIEMAARDLRYRYFAQLKRDMQVNAICVAHHQDDSVETVLMNLIRGTGVKGLAGISPVHGDIIRPLLCISRKDIEEFLLERKQEFVTDSTNLVADAVRNKIRLEVIPLLRQINPSVSQSIAQTALWMNEASRVLDVSLSAMRQTVVSYSDRSPDAVIVDIPALKAQVSPESVLYDILKDFGFSSHQVQQVYSCMGACSGTEFHSPSHQLVIDRGKILVEPVEKELPPTRIIPEEGTYVFGASLKFKLSLMDRNETFQISRAKDCVHLDAAEVRFPLAVRRIKEGDRFHPFGMNGSKLISDYLTDRKLSLFDKRRQLVVVNANDEVLWLVNERIDHKFRIKDNTKKILSIRFSRQRSL
ncbi:MAG: tRNA lysidine(34) synthetase TilS [Prevotellaceae bacterium]|nr:tRNA lysidine(34) synthetase TilS [Prevotellaceae bacterium]MDY6130376.1 tRNA lysidine(34) synthetase TilS [Prevotella sp.]